MRSHGGQVESAPVSAAKGPLSSIPDAIAATKQQASDQTAAELLDGGSKAKFMWHASKVVALEAFEWATPLDSLRLGEGIAQGTASGVFEDLMRLPIPFQKVISKVGRGGMQMAQQHSAAVIARGAELARDLQIDQKFHGLIGSRNFIRTGSTLVSEKGFRWTPYFDRSARRLSHRTVHQIDHFYILSPEKHKLDHTIFAPDLQNFNAIDWLFENKGSDFKRTDMKSLLFARDMKFKIGKDGETGFFAVLRLDGITPITSCPISKERVSFLKSRWRK